LTAPDLYTVNDADAPEAVVPSAISIEVRGAELHHTFPARSVTVIELAK
jgi:alpha-L-arabinofuranosidase